MSRFILDLAVAMPIHNFYLVNCAFSSVYFEYYIFLDFLN